MAQEEPGLYSKQLGGPTNETKEGCDIKQPFWFCEKTIGSSFSPFSMELLCPVFYLTRRCHHAPKSIVTMVDHHFQLLLSPAPSHYLLNCPKVFMIIQALTHPNMVCIYTLLHPTYLPQHILHLYSAYSFVNGSKTKSHALHLLQTPN